MFKRIRALTGIKAESKAETKKSENVEKISSKQDKEEDDKKISLSIDNPELQVTTDIKSEGRVSSGKGRLSVNVVLGNYNDDIREVYEIKEKILGTGLSGQVKTCVHIETGVEYAVKILSKRIIPANKIDELRQEISYMAALDHPNILRVHEFFENKDVIYIVMELCKGGQLLDRLNSQHDHRYSEKIACGYVHTMLLAVNYCHGKNIVHRDLKLENFLLETESSDSQLKLIDFGLSQYYKDQPFTSPVGTPYYIAPEVLLGKYDSKCDIWSIGVIAYMLLSGQPPFFGRTPADTLRLVKIGRFEFPDKVFSQVSEEAKDFISNCLKRSPNTRPTASELLEHHWFHLLRKSSKEEKDNTLKIMKRLQSFITRSPFQKICLEVIAYSLMPEQIEGLREEFIELDKTHTGEITLKDLKYILEKHPDIDVDFNKIIEGVGLDTHERISYREFIAATVSRQQITEENLKLAFEKISNHNTYFTMDDLIDLVGDDDDVDKEKLLTDFQSSDTKINYKQFKTLLMEAQNSPTYPGSPITKKASFYESLKKVASRDIRRVDSNEDFLAESK